MSSVHWLTKRGNLETHQYNLMLQQIWKAEAHFARHPELWDRTTCTERQLAKAQQGGHLCIGRFLSNEPLGNWKLKKAGGGGAEAEAQFARQPAAVR